MSDFSIIGKPIAFVDAAGKATGSGKYTDDLRVPGMLIGKILHSPLPHARVMRIDASKALALEGVVCVVTGTGLKDTETAIRNAPPFMELPADLATIEKALGLG